MKNLRAALRSFRSTPVISITALLSLALGIGATTAIFSILNGLLLKPLPVRDPQQLITLSTSGNPAEVTAISYPVWKEIRDRRLLDHAFVWATDRVSFDAAGENRFVETVWASGAFFKVLGIDALLGRTFEEADDRANGGVNGPVAVISYRFWQRYFGGAADAIGRRLTIDRVAFTIIGVTPPAFAGVNVGTTFDVILPLETEPLLGRTPARLDNPRWSWLQVMGRAAPDETVAAMTERLRAAQPQIRAATLPAFTQAEDRDRFLGKPWEVTAAPTGVSRFRGQYRPALLVLLTIVGVVMLIACANIATLLLAKTTARRLEFSVRRSLGASATHLWVQLLSESVLLSVGGAVAGLLLARWSASLLVGQLSTWAYTATLDLSPDWRVAAVAAGATMLTAVLCNIAPAARAIHSDPIDAIRPQHTGTLRERRLGPGGALVVAQVALSLLLVVVAGLFLRSFTALAYRDIGFDRDRVLVAIVDARRSVTPSAARLALFEQLRDAAASVPGVETASVSMATPLGSAGVRFTPMIAIPGSAAASTAVRILTTPVSAEWFRTYGTTLLAGRDFDSRDRENAAPVAIVNQAFARRYFDGGNPVGRTITETGAGQKPRSIEVVGLVEDAAFTSVRDAIEPAIYAPIAQRVSADLFASFPSISISVRPKDGSPVDVTRSVINAIVAVDPGLAVSIQSVAEQLNVFYIRERLLAQLSVFFGAFALFLAGLGLYAVTAYGVSRRRVEIGIRMAIGAEPRMVRQMILQRVLLLAGLGIVAGSAVSFWAVRVVRTLLYEIAPRDTATFAVAGLVLVVVAAIAGWLPARRAARLDPATVLRQG